MRFRAEPFIELVRSVIPCMNNRMVWKRKQRSLLLSEGTEWRRSNSLGFSYYWCIFFFLWSRIGGVSEIYSISVNHFLLWLAAVCRCGARQQSLWNNCLWRTDEPEVLVKGECAPPPINYCIIIYQEHFCSLSLEQPSSGILRPTLENGPSSAKYLTVCLKAKHWFQQLA